MDILGRISISDLYPKSKSRCGIYLLSFKNDTFYIEQAIDFVKRFSQHCKNFTNIQQCRFLSVKREKLDAIEKNLIYQAERNGLLFINKVHISNIIGETVLKTESAIINCIKEMNLRLMRKGGTIFSKYHCFDLVHDILLKKINN